MIVDPVPLIKDLFCFLLDVKNVSGTILEARIEQVCGGGHKKHEVYKLKEGAGRLYRNVSLFNDA